MGLLSRPTTLQWWASLHSAHRTGFIPLVVSVHGSKVTKVQGASELRTGRGRSFAVQWPKDMGRSDGEARLAFKFQMPAPISSRDPHHRSGVGDKRLWRLR